MKGESEVETAMEQKNLKMCRRSKLANVVKSDGEPVTGRTLKAVIDGDDGDSLILLKWYITINSKICHTNRNLNSSDLKHSDNILNATNSPCSICCVAEHLLQEYEISEPTTGDNNKYI